MEFFGSFISMDDPRHARQRGIVARSFTPKQLQGVLDSVETICAEVVDEMCERGEVDLVEALSKPFPLLVICDMMGIPRSEFDTVLDATNIILGAGDPDVLGGRDPMSAMFGAGMQLTTLVNELAELRRAEPADDLISALVNAEGDRRRWRRMRSPRSSSCSRSRATTRRGPPSATACTCCRRTRTSADAGRPTSKP